MLHQNTAGIARVIQIAGAESFFHRLRIAQQVIALLATLHPLIAFNSRDKFRPAFGIVLQPFKGGAAFLFLIGLGEAKRLVDETIIAKARPGQNMVHLNAIVLGTNGAGWNRLIRVDAAHHGVFHAIGFCH